MVIELLIVLLWVISEFVGTNENERIKETPDTATKILEETIQNNTNNSHVSNHCIDFYETACGEWEKLNHLPKDDASLTTLQRMGMNVDNYFWKIIANDSYYKEDRRLQSARAFYKSCVNSRNSNTTRDSRHHLIHRYFGGWELIPSLSTNINNTNKHKQNKMNNGLTNLFLPILTQTGRSPLFSINIASDIFAVIISPGRFAFHLDSTQTTMNESEEDYYRLAFETGVHLSKKTQLTEAFQTMIRLGKIDWSHVLEKVLKQTGYVNYQKLPIIIEQRSELRQRCSEYRDLLNEKDGGRSPIGSPVFLVTAFYATDGNRIYLLSGLLQPPLYYENASLASKYGALGWIISHEIMHAIGIKGVLFDENRNKRNSFDAIWSTSLIHSRAVCLSAQYSSYKFTNLKVSLTDTQEEILADNNGLKASYYTYRRLLNKFSNNVSQDHHQSLASDRLFFLSFAQGLCGHHGANMLELDSVVQPHVLEKFRVTGVLVNNNRFARAYGCPVGSPMNPKMKCDVW
ncbi:family M13 unassigned peptidase (M13 family) [Schistosoma mansoni]|uniref:family M13 unassigned peptidase (M13 family) n=1 Tax=Schistosoma mansoni TaxID=6183 RepID=UPI0001A620AB|nr:family M13 unassigned peptidase (M13 family) [Schistosoma mansoni]|eukprot:XP_018650341.1 family M13 unassigned peptidase (M13 family) [Schistosoma mansoni]